jgi:hypothetical protein
MSYTEEFLSWREILYETGRTNKKALTEADLPAPFRKIQFRVASRT